MSERLENLATQIVDCAVKVHTRLGPGLLEGAYQVCLAHLLQTRGIRVRCEVVLPIDFDGVRLDSGYRVDMLIEESIIVENKSVQKLTDVHQAQLLTYLKLSGLHIGFLINWNVARVKDGLKRMVHRL